MATSLAQLRTRVQVLYDVAGSQVLTDDQWDELINDSYRKLWRTVVRINKSFRINVDPFVLVGGANYQRVFDIAAADTPPPGGWSFANGTFTSADAGRLLSPRFTGVNTPFNIDYTITQVLTSTSVHVSPSPAAGFINPAAGTVVVSAGQIRRLPDDYRETMAVRLNPGTDQQSILERLPIRRAGGRWDRAYRLQDRNLYVEPLQRCAGTYDHLYIPNVTILVADTDAVDAELEQFAAFITYDAANVALAREESERLYEIDFQREEKDVISWASSQRSADPDVVEDVRKRSWWNWGTP